MVNFIGSGGDSGTSSACISSSNSLSHLSHLVEQSSTSISLTKNPSSSINLSISEEHKHSWCAMLVNKCCKHATDSCAFILHLSGFTNLKNTIFESVYSLKPNDNSVCLFSTATCLNKMKLHWQYLARIASISGWQCHIACHRIATVNAGQWVKHKITKSNMCTDCLKLK